MVASLASLPSRLFSSSHRQPLFVKPDDEPATLGKVVERLEAKKFINRRPAPEDKRTKRLFLTRAGAALLDAAEPPVQQSQERILALLAAKDKKTRCGCWIRSSSATIIRHAGRAGRSREQSGAANCMQYCIERICRAHRNH